MGSSSHTDAQGAPVRPRIVFSDMDDTFLAPDKSLLPRNMAMLDRLADDDLDLRAVILDAKDSSSRCP